MLNNLKHIILGLINGLFYVGLAGGVGFGLWAFYYVISTGVNPVGMRIIFVTIALLLVARAMWEAFINRDQNEN
jgi:hypothetical protein